MRMLILAAAVAAAVSVVDVPQAAAQAGGVRPMAAPSPGGRRGGPRPASRFERRLEAARVRGNDPSRDIWSGFRWGSPMDASGGSRRQFRRHDDDFDLCRIRRGGGPVSGLMFCGRARQLSEDLPGIAMVGPGGTDLAPPPPLVARPVVRRLDGRRVVRGAAEPPGATFAIRTVRR